MSNHNVSANDTESFLPDHATKLSPQIIPTDLGPGHSTYNHGFDAVNASEASVPSLEDFLHMVGFDASTDMGQVAWLGGESEGMIEPSSSFEGNTNAQYNLVATPHPVLKDPETLLVAGEQQQHHDGLRASEGLGTGELGSMELTSHEPTALFRESIGPKLAGPVPGDVETTISATPVSRNSQLVAEDQTSVLGSQQIATTVNDASIGTPDDSFEHAKFDGFINSCQAKRAAEGVESLRLPYEVNGTRQDTNETSYIDAPQNHGTLLADGTPSKEGLCAVNNEDIAHQQEAVDPEDVASRCTTTTPDPSEESAHPASDCLIPDVEQRWDLRMSARDKHAVFGTWIDQDASGDYDPDLKETQRSTKRRKRGRAILRKGTATAVCSPGETPPAPQPIPEPAVPAPKPPGVVALIQTRLSHPITFNSAFDPLKLCHWCSGTTPQYPLFGHLVDGKVALARDVKVLMWNNKQGCTELKGGFIQLGKEPSRMCAYCTLQRVKVMFCRRHVFRQLPLSEGEDGKEIAREAESRMRKRFPVVAMQRLGRVVTADSHVKRPPSKPNEAFNPIRAELAKWCAVCPAIATYECCAGDKMECTLRLCTICHALLHMSNVGHSGDFVKFIAQIGQQIKDKPEVRKWYPRGLRPDYDFYRWEGFMMRQVRAQQLERLAQKDQEAKPKPKGKVDMKGKGRQV